MASKTVDEAAAEARSTDGAAVAADDAREGAEGGKTPAETASAPQSGTSEAAGPQATAGETSERAAAAPGTAGPSEAAQAVRKADNLHDVDDLQDVDGGETAAEYGRTEVKEPSGVGQGAGAIVAAALGVVSLTGSWVGTVAAARESLMGQLQTSQSAGVAKQVQEVYGDQWHVTALVGGIFALLALIVGVAVLARPAFGAPAASQPLWVKSVAWSGVALGVIGLLLAVAKYTDVLLGLPTTS